MTCNVFPRVTNGFLVGFSTNSKFNLKDEISS